MSRAFPHPTARAARAFSLRRAFQTTDSHDEQRRAPADLKRLIDLTSPQPAQSRVSALSCRFNCRSKTRGKAGRYSRQPQVKQPRVQPSIGS